MLKIPAVATTESAKAPNFSSEMSLKKTAGAKVKEFLDKHDGHLSEAGEVLECVFADLEKIITDIRQKCSGLSEYYIVTQTDRIPWLGNAMYLRTWWRRTRPEPQFKQDVYLVKNPGDQMVAQWSIPFRANCEAIKANPQAYDPQLAKWVMQFLDGTLQ